MPSAGRRLYEWVQVNNPNAQFWDDMSAVDRRWWNSEALRQRPRVDLDFTAGRYRVGNRTSRDIHSLLYPRPPLTWPQRLAIWALGVTVCGGAISALVGLVWYAVSR